MHEGYGYIKTVDDWWMYIAVDESIGEYYRYMLNKKHVAHFQCSKPKWGTHISIVRGEKIENLILWKEIFGKYITFKYEDITLTGGKSFCLNVYCEEALDLRKALGLTRNPIINLHITYGVIDKNKFYTDNISEMI